MNTESYIAYIVFNAKHRKKKSTFFALVSIILQLEGERWNKWGNISEV